MKTNSALEDGMSRVCDKLDQEKAASVKTMIQKRKLPKVIRRRGIPLKGEKPVLLGGTSSASISRWPWLKRPARPVSRPRS